MSQVLLLSRQSGDDSLQMMVNLSGQVSPSPVSLIQQHRVQCEEIRCEMPLLLRECSQKVQQLVDCE
jgi:hypothetical protein